jgi:hypothetical protein
VQTPTHQPRTPRRPRIAAAVSLLALTSCVTLSACGGSSNPKPAANSTSNGQGATTATAAAGATGANAAGQTANGGTGQGGSTQPGATHNGESSAHNGQTGNSGNSNQSSSVSSKYPAAFVAALHTFTNCVRSHGLNIPEPNLSGHGEIFNKSSVNPNNPNYRAALQACEADLIAILRAAGGSRIQGLGG